MNLQEIEDFIALSEARSFSRAAEARFVSQSAFSRRIKSLEDSLGTTLIDRTGTPIALTAAGEGFLRHALSMKGIMNYAIEEIHARATNLPNALQVAMPASLASGFFPLWYRDLQRSITDLSFHLMHYRSAVAIEELRKGTIDFAIVLHTARCQRDLNLNGLKKCTIGSDRFFFVAASHLKDRRKLITHRKGSYINNCAETMLGTRYLSQMTTTFEAPSSEISRSMAMAGFGCAILQESLIANDMTDGYLVHVDKKIRPLPCEILLLCSSSAQNDRIAKVWKACQGLSTIL